MSNAFAESTLESAAKRLEMVLACKDEGGMDIAARCILRRALGEVHSAINLLRMQERLERATTERPGPLLSLVTR
jgi:hypothetical protein